MSHNFTYQPEMALRRALELEQINQDEAALEMLHSVLSNRRHRSWSPYDEQIMMTYLDLCLKMNKARETKDGLHQYRNISQTQAPGSLEKVIRYLIAKAEQKCTDAKAFADAEAASSTAGEADEEGFVGASPQAILLSTMSTDPEKSQRDYALFLPSLKFLWETYRAVLDILRSNSKLEHVYHATAQNALIFCRVYKRRIEFRNLSDMLRMHLGNLRQYGSIAQLIDGSKANSKVRGFEGWTTESIELHLETRFVQLETASILHRYTEGFRTCEDIFNILSISRHLRKLKPELPPLKAKLMASYYEKLTTLFWVSENYLFHAFAWHRYYMLCAEFNRVMSDEVKQRQASAVLLAALCIPSLPKLAGSEDKHHGISSTVEDGIARQKKARMATLLGFSTRNPTRDALLAEIRAKNVLVAVPEYLRDLYVLMEETHDPLTMVEKAYPLLEQLKNEVGATTGTDTEKYNDDIEDTSLGRYVKPLTHVLLLKLIINLSTAYHTVSIDHLKKLTDGLGMSFDQVEKSIVLFGQSKTLSVRIDHRAGCLRFGDADLESEAMRSQLTVLSQQLEAVCSLISPPEPRTNRTQVIADIRANLLEEHRAAIDRKQLIEQRKEEAERLAQEKVKEQQRKKTEAEATRRAEDAERLAREQRQREAEKQRKIQQELENQEKKRFLAAMGRNMDSITEEQIAKIDTEALQREHQQKILKEKEDADRKLKETAKKLDYLVRAIRIEELPLIKARYKERVKSDRERYGEETKSKMELAKKQWEEDVQSKAKFEEHRVFEFLSAFEEKVMAGRKLHHDRLCREADKEAEMVAEQGKLERARRRKFDEEKRQAEEERMAREEEERQKQEEQDRARREAKKARMREDQERMQAERERMEGERQRGASKSGAYVPPGARHGGGASGPSGGGWRGSGGSGYPGGGRYEGRSEGGNGGVWRGGGGGGSRGPPSQGNSRWSRD